MATPKRVFGPAALTNAAATKYTVPAGVRFTLRQVHVSNPSALPVDLTLSVGADAAATRLIDGFPIPADSVQDFWFYLTIEAAEIIQAWASTTTVLVITLSGDLDAV